MNLQIVRLFTRWRIRKVVILTMKIKYMISINIVSIENTYYSIFIKNKTPNVYHFH